MSHRINKDKGTLEHRLDGYYLSLILEDVSKCIKKSFDYSNNRSYILQQLTQIKYNLQRRHKRIIKRTKNSLQKQQDRASVSLEKFYEIIGKDRSIIPNTSQTPNLELTLASNQHLEESSLNLQENQKIESDNLDSWIDDLLYCLEDIDDLVSLQEYEQMYCSFEQQLSQPIVDTPETSTPQKDKNLLEIEIEDFVMTTFCSHNWIGNRGSNDKPCMYCFKYPVLHLTSYICHKEACTFCLKDLNSPLPPTQKPPINNTSKHETLELRILHLENLLHELQVKLEILELKLKRNG